LPKLLTPRKPRLGHHGRMRILVVEDEPLLADAVAEWLRGDAHAVDVAYDADACHAKAEQLGDKCGL
jgi:CheY-like chemotaxis protein